MIVYRPYRNTDPPLIADIWNEAFNSPPGTQQSGRGAVPLRNPSPLERWLFNKTYFDHQAMTIAEEVGEDGKKRVVGFSLAGFGPDEEQTKLDTSYGIVAGILVRPDAQRHGVGSELLRRAEGYLTSKGATTIVVGSQSPMNPYFFGLYGGGNSPGILDSDALAKPFLTKHGYQPAESVVVFQKSLEQPMMIADARLALLKRRYEVHLLKAAAVASWWQECVWSSLDPAEFRVMDKLTGMPAARAVAWELEGFNWRWNAPSAGIIDIQVRDDLRKQGIAKMLLLHILRFLQDQFFGIVELQARADDPAGVGLCKSLGFEQVDVGYVYRKPAAN